MKSHFGEVYENLITTGARIHVPGTIANIQELEDGDDSLGTITGAMSTMQMANNANAQQVRSDVSVLRQELAMMRTMLQQANNVRLPVHMALPVQPAPPQYTPQPAPPFAQYAPPPAPAPGYYPPPAMTAYAAVPAGPPLTPAGPPLGFQGAGRGRQGRQGRGGGNNKRAAAFGRQSPSQQGQATQQGGQATGGNDKTFNKYYNNWTMYISCGFDIPGWHTSKACPAICRGPNHQEGCNRQNYQQYAAQGYNVNMKQAHNTILPTNPHEGQA